MGNTEFILAIAFIIFLTAWKGFKMVPQQSAWIVERMGKFNQTLLAGLHFIIPYVDKVAYKHSLKEEAVDIPSQSAITRDNVTLIIDGILYLKITDPKQASYGVQNPRYAVHQLAQTPLRSGLGRGPLRRKGARRRRTGSGSGSVGVPPPKKIVRGVSGIWSARRFNSAIRTSTNRPWFLAPTWV